MSESMNKTNNTSTPDVPEVSSEFKKPSKITSNDRHLQKSCYICLKTMRGDNLNRHIASHNSNKAKCLKTACITCGKIMRKDNIKRHMKIHKPAKSANTVPSEQDTVSLLKYDQKLFNDKCQTGSYVKNALITQNIEPQSLRKYMRDALEIHDSYSKQDMTSSTLKGWQKDLLTLMDSPSDREIIWIIGKNGNEGKTWLQKYIEQHFGTRKVFKSSIVKDVSSLLYILSKRTLTCTDIFLLNIARSFEISDVPYTVLENIKDGEASSSKYDSKILNFCTPNVLVIFSNYSPVMSKVSKDRWRIYTIDEENDSLIYSNNDEQILSNTDWYNAPSNSDYIN